MEALIKQRAKTKAAITRIDTFFNRNKLNDIDINEYCIREGDLIKAFEKYVDIQDQIEELDDSQESDRLETETKYYSLHAAIKTKIQSSFVPPVVAQQPPLVQSNVLNQVQLPNLNIPSFSGKYEDWQSFIDLFTALIDNNYQLTNAQKFVYLKTALKDEPFKLIEKLQLTNENYVKALDILKQRYDNKLVLIKSHIKHLIDIPQVGKGNANNLREFLTQVTQHLNSLESLNVPTKEWDLLLIYIFSQKIDFNTRQAYELGKSSTKLPTLKEFFAFVEKRCVALENLSSTPEPKRKVSHVASNNNFEIKLKCVFCKLTNHNIYKCFKFKALSNMQKRQFIQGNKLCFNCFGSKHVVENCTSQGCSICQKRHHTLLHSDSGQSHNSVPASQANGAAPNNKNISQANTAYALNNDTLSRNESTDDSVQESTGHTAAYSALSDDHGVQILLATANVTLVAANGKRIQAKALLDNGSQTSFISQELFKKLNYNCYAKNTHISGISNNSTFSNYMVDVVLYSQTESNRNFKVSCAILNKITCQLPQVAINKSSLHIPQNINLADSLFHSPSKIDLLLGSDIYYDIIAPGLINLGNNLPTLQNSHLGWVIAGPVSIQNCLTNFNVSLFSRTCDINELIPRFWQLEEVSNKHFLSPEDKLCEKIFMKTTTHLQNGSFGRFTTS